MELTEEDGYEGVVEEIEALKMKIHSGGTDINPNRLLNQNHDSNQVLKKLAQSRSNCTSF